MPVVPATPRIEFHELCPDWGCSGKYGRASEIVHLLYTVGSSYSKLPCSLIIVETIYVLLKRLHFILHISLLLSNVDDFILSYYFFSLYSKKSLNMFSSHGIFNYDL